MKEDIFPWEEDGLYTRLESQPSLFDKALDKMTAFELIGKIVSKSEESMSMESALNKTNIYCLRLAANLGITEEAAFLLSFFIENMSADSQGTPLVTLASDIRTSVTDILGYYKHLRFLLDNGYLLKRGPGIYTIPDSLLQCLSENRPFDGHGDTNNLFMRIANKDIPERELIFDARLSEWSSLLESLLQNESFLKYQEAMSDRKHSKGFCALFHGESGTGKTELAMQLARKTGRDVLVIDCAQIASKWIGDSEKNARAVFSSYRKMMKSSNLAPVLLLNEAESLLSKRIEGISDGYIDDNRIVGIFLEEMERFDGIMVATCNNASMLEPALSRRFLFKIEFHCPSEEVRTNLLLKKLSLPNNMATKLAKKRLTGAQIENMSKVLLIDRILGRVPVNVQEEPHARAKQYYS